MLVTVMTKTRERHVFFILGVLMKKIGTILLKHVIYVYHFVDSVRWLSQTSMQEYFIGLIISQNAGST